MGKQRETTGKNRGELRHAAPGWHGLDGFAAAGFTAIDVEPTRIYTRDDAREIAASASCCGGDVEAALGELDGAAMSAFVRARKPA